MFVTLLIRDYPLDHWTRPHIIHSVGPVVNPHFLDPVCITDVDFSAVIITLKAKEAVDIPETMFYKNHDGSGAVGRISITHIGPLQNPDSDSESTSSDDDDDVPLGDPVPAADAQEPATGSDITMADPSSSDARRPFAAARMRGTHPSTRALPP